MIKDQVWWPGNQCCGQTTNPKHRFKTTISNFVVISEKLTKNSPEITRLPKMGPTQWYCVNYRTECNCKHHLWPLGTKLTYELVDTEILSRSSTCLNKKTPRTYRFELTIRILEDWSVPLKPSSVWKKMCFNTFVWSFSKAAFIPSNDPIYWWRPWFNFEKGCGCRYRPILADK